MRALSFMERLSLASQYFCRIKKIMKFPYKSLDEIRAYQFKEIKALLIEAYENVDFYKKFYDEHNVDVYTISSLEEFSEKIPCITKKDIIENTQAFINKKYKNKPLILSRSSGSSGTMVDLYADSSLYTEIELRVIRMIKEIYSKYSAFEKEVLVYTSEYPVSSIMGMYRSFFVSNLLNYEKIFEFILEKKPTVIAIYPSILREIIQHLSYDFKSLGIKLIITNSEASTQLERDDFAKIFDCDVIDEFSSEELQSIAYQCSEKKYHEVSDCTYIEILELNSDKTAPMGEIGEITGTCLLNHAMPMIRYRQGDLATLTVTDCACNKCTPILKHLEGRKNSSFLKRNGEIIPSGKLLDWAYSLVLDKSYKISEYKIIQESFEAVTILIVCNSLSEQDMQEIAESFKAMFGEEFTVSVELVDRIEKTKAGKQIPIISKIIK